MELAGIFGSTGRQVLALLAALAGACSVAVLVARVDFTRRGGRVLSAYNAPVATTALDVDINTALGLVRPAYAPYIYAGATLGALGALLLAGLPLAPALGGAALAYVLADEFLKGRPRKVRLAIEQELPTFVSRLGGMLLVTGAPRSAVEEVTGTLLEGRPLRVWFERLLAGWQAHGESYLAAAHLEANVISPLLGLTVYQVRRLAETGSAGAARAFGTTAEELSAILEARAVAGSKAEAARQAVLTMLVIMAVILGIMLASPTIRQGYADPTAQIVAAGALAVMGFGYLTLNGMIADALEG
jgi:hypothetical protein